MSTSPLRLLVAGLILLLLARAAIVAWRHRDLARTVWRRVGWRQAAGAFGLLMLVATVGVILLEYVAPLRWGLGNLVGFTGNAVFAPLEEAAVRAGPAPASGPDWTIIAIATAFLGPLLLLLPWLAFVEEEVFRAGLEDASVTQEIAAALRFGLAHLIMLVPIGAALAVGVAGFVYGRIYRRGYERWDRDALPPSILRTFRSSPRARAAADRVRSPAPSGGVGPTVLADLTPERRQIAGVLTSTVWHTTFNSLVVTLVWVLIVYSAWVG